VRLVIECRGNGVPQALAQQGAAVAAPSPHIFAHAPRRVGGPADRDTDLSCRAQGRTDHPTARKFDTKRTIRSGGHPRSASRRQIISVGNCPVPDVNRVRDVRDGSHKRRFAPPRTTSGLPPTTDITHRDYHFRKVPKNEPALRERAGRGAEPVAPME